MGQTVYLKTAILAALLVLAAGSAGAQETAGADSIQGNGYTVGGGDVIEVNVWKNPELSRTVTVRPDGMISLPLIADIAAAGSSVGDLQKKISQALLDANLISQPVVSIGIIKATGYRVYVLGAATTNGMYALTGPVTALQMLAQAGGLTEDADLDKAYMLRNNKRIPLALASTIGGQGEVHNPVLLPGDTLVVPRRASLEEPIFRILVAGEVMNTQAIPFEEGITLIDAFVQAGGGTEYADLDSVRVIRREKGKDEQVLRVNLTKLMKKGDLKENIELVPGDIVIVP